MSGVENEIDALELPVAPERSKEGIPDTLGQASPSSATVYPNGVNFSVFSQAESEPVLSATKLIAEAWDAAGLYQVGRFIGDSWKEWNGRFRDDVGSFLRGDKGTISGDTCRVKARSMVVLFVKLQNHIIRRG